MEDRTFLLCIVLGLSWKDFSATWRLADSMAPSATIRMTIASALFLTSVGLMFTIADLWIGLATAFLGTMLALLAWQRMGSNIALLTAAASFAVYLDGMTS
ncbi:hypothetical protein [Rhizobium sp. SG2393]|uniref:hypothetical protein n=1 Tax=Rhizobium sp. SG2393 TaxID=3276279 RepID=UPI00366D2B47